MKHIKRHILTIVLISIILALILNIKENKNIADDILFLKSIQKNEEEKNQKKQNKIRENQEKNMEYKFNVSWKNTNYNQVNLTDTIKKQTLINKKIAPGLEGRFNIILTTNKDSKYYIKFENKIIYVLSYKNKDQWENALGGQYGCVYIDEGNIADIDFVREILTRNDYLCITLNPDDPNLPIYDEVINHARPYKKYANDVPMEIMKELNKVEPKKNYRYWFFTFYDNKGLTEEEIEKKKTVAPIGTKLYKNKIQGLRGKATGLCFNLQPKNIITLEEAKKMKFKLFSIGCDTSYSKESHDKVTLEGIGITADNKCVLLEERTFNNRDRTIPFAPSDVVQWIVEFMEEFKNEWGFARTCFIDNADQGTIMEANKAKRQNALVYNFENAWKKTKIITRVQLQESWLNTGDFLIVETCKDYIDECNKYSFDEDNQPEDGNDHSINGCQYAWLPHKKKIGNWEVIKKLIKDESEE